MAEIALKGQMKVKTLKSEFKKAFGSTLRVYKSESCKGAFADDDAMLFASQFIVDCAEENDVILFSPVSLSSIFASLTLSMMSGTSSL